MFAKRVETALQTIMHPDVGVLVIVQAGAAQFAVTEIETQRANEVQLNTGIGAKAYDIPGIRRDLRLIKNQVKH